MSSNDNCFLPGELIFHPRYGFGAVQGLTRQDRVDLIMESTSADPDEEQTQDYYDIRLDQGGTLLVPVSRAESVGLRHLTYGIEAVKTELCTRAENLPADARERAALLRLSDRIAEPVALAHSVRDLVAHGRKHALTASDKKWLDKSCLRLSTEVALVDSITMREAEDAVNSVVREQQAQSL
jgi:RNA polymerase-interacting CarD/CdnL/TRCF family regulator